MDNRVGTGSTLARGYGFLFGHVVDLIGLGWLAAVFYGASIFFLLQRLAAALLVAPPATPLVNQFTLPYFAGMLLATAFFGGAMAVALTRTALGNLESRAGVYFVYGSKEVRAFWAFVKLYVISVALTLATGFLALKVVPIAAAQVSSNTLWLGTAPMIWFTGVGAFLTVCMFVFVEARLGFFLAPLAASGESPLLRHAWRLSRGNSLAIFVATFVMLLFVFGILAGCYFGFSDSSFNATMIAQRGDPAMWHALQASAGAIAAICAITLTVLNGLFAGASASAYAVVEGSLERVETASTDHVADAVPVMAAPAFAHADAGAFPLRAGEPFVAGVEKAEPVAAIAEPAPSSVVQPVNVISEPVSTVAAETALPQPVARVENHAAVAETGAPSDPQPADHTADQSVTTSEKGHTPADQPAPEAEHAVEIAPPDETSETITPPLSSSGAPQASPEHAPLEVV